ncbi:unnamed protein product, partial [marine sediment metagenome]
YLMNLSLGQTDVVITLLFVLFLIAYAGNKEILCGVLLALILQFKLSFLPILLYFLFTGRITLIVSTGIGFALFLFIPSYMIGFEKNLLLLKDWVDILGFSVPS